MGREAWSMITAEDEITSEQQHACLEAIAVLGSKQLAIMAEFGLGVDDLNAVMGLDEGRMNKDKRALLERVKQHLRDEPEGEGHAREVYCTAPGELRTLEASIETLGLTSGILVEDADGQHVVAPGVRESARLGRGPVELARRVLSRIRKTIVE